MNGFDIHFTRLTTTAIIPTYATELAAGMDLCADLGRMEAVAIWPGKTKLVKTGIAIALPYFMEAQIRSRSGLALKKGIIVLNAPGTIDPDYRGDIGVILFNTSDAPFTVSQGDRIAQLVIAPFARATLTEVPDLPETVRGDGGFGHTGISVNAQGLSMEAVRQIRDEMRPGGVLA
jgi:dUTP pyrophosphatase